MEDSIVKAIEQIKMRKDIYILKNKYKISVSSLAKTFEVTERTIREFIDIQRNLSDKNFKKINTGLVKIKQQVIDAENYRGFND